MKLEEIKEIAELMTAHDLTEFEVEEEGKRMSMRRGSTAMPVAQPLPMAIPQTTPAATPAPVEALPDDSNYDFIKAPFVGTFYQSSSPDSPPYVKVGQEISTETVLCIVEAMKVMNEIKAEVNGIVREIMVENAQPVQYGQPLFKIEKI